MKEHCVYLQENIKYAIEQFRECVPDEGGPFPVFLRFFFFFFRAFADATARAPFELSPSALVVPPAFKMAKGLLVSIVYVLAFLPMAAHQAVKRAIGLFTRRKCGSVETQQTRQ